MGREYNGVYSRPLYHAHTDADLRIADNYDSLKALQLTLW